MHRKIGLFVIDKTTKQTIILKRSTPYNDSTYVVQQDGFVEEYCIPRGGLKHEHESELECGIREFIEECQIFFSEFYILPETFNLQWRDPPNKLWKYKILFLLVSMKDSFTVLPFNVRLISDKICTMIREIDFSNSIVTSNCNECITKFNVTCVKSAITHVKIPHSVIYEATNNQLNMNKIPQKLQHKILVNRNLSSLIENHKILKPFRKDIKKIQGIQRENIYKMIMPVNHYILLMNNRLKLYANSNYMDFFIFLRKLILTYNI